MNKAQKIIISIIGILIVVTIIVAMKATSEGAALVSLEKKSAELELQNSALKEKVVNGMSLTKIGEDAEKLGFQKPETITYLNRENLTLSAEAR